MAALLDPPQPNTEVDAAFDRILEKVASYNPDADLDLLRRAYELARNKHAGQFRRSGAPYISHPVAVVEILANLEMDMPTLVAGFLHDVVEDTTVCIDAISQRFGPEVAALVDGVTKLALVTRDLFADSGDEEESP